VGALSTLVKAAAERERYGNLKKKGNCKQEKDDREGK
jgi:hypothetical protein